MRTDRNGFTVFSNADRLFVSFSAILLLLKNYFQVKYLTNI